LALTLRDDRHWAEPHETQARVVREQHRRKQNVPHDPAIIIGDQRDQLKTFRAERLDEIGLGRRVERGFVYATNSGAIGLYLPGECAYVNTARSRRKSETRQCA
jgi:hypothetical protein